MTNGQMLGEDQYKSGRPVKLTSLMGVQFPLMGWIGGGGERQCFFQGDYQN